MGNLLSARLLMALSLSFHIFFASISMILPFLMFASHLLSKKKQDSDYEKLTRFWTKGVAILFAVGAVSGTILSFELGLLWPTFMQHAGPIFGMPFSFEGTAFFIEAIALGFFLYGKNKIPDFLHTFSGLMVGVAGLASGILVISANAWMNSPSGFVFENGIFHSIDPIAAMFNAAWLGQAMHMVAAAGQATCFLVAGIHAALILSKKNVQLHQKAFKIAIIPACIISLILPLTGDFAAKSVFKRQPVKFAAMEAHFHTEKGATFNLGGIPNLETYDVDYAIKIPKLLSILAKANPNAEVKGLLDFDRDLWPNVKIVHLAFQIMIAIGSFFAGLSLILLFFLFKKAHLFLHPYLLKLLVCVAPLGFIAIEAGWIVTEVGRQPWIIYGIMKTKDAVTPVPGMDYYLYLFTSIYVLLAITVLWLMQRQFQASLKDD